MSALTSTPAAVLQVLPSVPSGGGVPAVAAFLGLLSGADPLVQGEMSSHLLCLRRVSAHVPSLNCDGTLAPRGLSTVDAVA